MMEETITFFIKKITTDQFAIVEESFSKDKEISLVCTFRFGIEKRDKMIAAVTSVRLEQDKAPFLIIEVSCQFIVHDDSWKKFTKEESEKIVVDKGFATHLLSITVGTTRGVLHAKTEGSQFNEYLLPTINLVDAVKSDLVFPPTVAV